MTDLYFFTVANKRRSSIRPRCAASVDENKPLLCDQKSFNDAIEAAIKMLDKLDHYDRMFAVQE